MKEVVAYVARAFLALFLSFVTYLYGMLAGHMVELRPLSDFCSDEKEYANPSSTWTWVPLSHQCQWADGSSKSLVPWYVNPLVVIFMGLFVAGLVMAVRTAVLIDREAAAAESEVDYEGECSDE